ncbi:MAG: enoyl-CoA hydratase/isomerase family protein [Sporichthyaceae bacterium]
MSEAATASVTGRVLDVRLTAPERGNAFDLDSAATLAKALQVGDGIGALALTHDGPNFCVGGDVRGFSDATDPEAYLLALANAAHECVLALTNAGVPVVVGARGWAAGAGMALLLTADIVVLGESARMRVAYPAIGITPDCGMTWNLPRVVGQARAREILLTNRAVDAQEALRIGIASHVVPDGEVEDVVAQIAAGLAMGPTQAYRGIRRLLDEGADRPFAEHLEFEARSIAAAGASREGSEGIGAFLEKRPADFHGSTD